MNPRLVVAVALVTAVTMFAAGVALAPRGTDGAGATTAQGTIAGALRPPGIPPADFALRDQDGERVSVADLRGQVTVVTFLYTTCEDACPLVAQQIRGALDLLGRDVPVLAVSVDPAGDTQRSARSFLLDQRLPDRMDFLLGSSEELRPVWDDFGIQPQATREDGPQSDHSVSVVLLDRDGVQRIGYPINGLTPDALASDIALLESEGEGTRR
ncbi:MAG: SCO family protein [Solirubrobacteraceae bacterium MAG38_C4-C5]|nr:SCO family protein [Candidatus Siliceabacter maunaloa]